MLMISFIGEYKETKQESIENKPLDIDNKAEVSKHGCDRVGRDRDSGRKSLALVVMMVKV